MISYKHTLFAFNCTGYCIHYSATERLWLLYGSNHENSFTSGSRLSMNLSTTCRRYLKLSSRTKSYSQSAGDITIPACDLWSPADDLWPRSDLARSQFVGVNCPLTVCWSEMDSVAGDWRSAGDVEQLWTAASDAMSTDTLLPPLRTSLRDAPDCDTDNVVSAGACTPARTKSTDTLLPFLAWTRDLQDTEVWLAADWATGWSSSPGGGVIFNSLCINFFKSERRWSCFLITL